MRFTIALGLALLLTIGNAPAAAAEEGRTLLDATILVIPGEVYRMCMDLPAGTLGTTTRLMHRDDVTNADGTPRLSDGNVDINLYPYRGTSGMPAVQVSITSAEATYVTPIGGGLHCLSLINRTVVPPGQSGIWQAQYIALKLTIEPVER